MMDYLWNVSTEELTSIASKFKGFAPVKVIAGEQELYVYQNLTVVPMTEANRMFLAPICNDTHIASLQTFVWSSDRKSMCVERPIKHNASDEEKGYGLSFAVESYLRSIKFNKPETEKVSCTDADRLEFMQTKAKQYDALIRRVDFPSASFNQEVDDDRSIFSMMHGGD